MERAPRNFAGPRQRFGPGPQTFGPQAHGPAWNRPQFAPRGGAGGPEICPHCQRPLARNAAPGMQRPGGQGFDPREKFGPRQRGWGNVPQGRGPAFGPPPWAGRGRPDADVRPGVRGLRDAAPSMPRRDFGPRPRGFQGPPPGQPPRDREDVRP